MAHLLSPNEMKVRILAGFYRSTVEVAFIRAHRETGMPGGAECARTDYRLYIEREQVPAYVRLRYDELFVKGEALQGTVVSLAAE